MFYTIPGWGLKSVTQTQKKDLRAGWPAPLPASPWLYYNLPKLLLLLQW